MKPRDRTRRFFARPLESGSFGTRVRHIPRWFWLAAGVWLVWVAVLSDHSFWRIGQLRREISRAETDARDLKKSTEALEQKVADPYARRFHAEEIARTQHGWAAPDEVVYRFRGGEARADTAR